MINRTQIQKTYFQVRGFRKAYGDIYPTPDVIDSCRYMLSEIGEAYSATLRATRPDHKRNNKRDEDPYEEIADVFIMASTSFNDEEAMSNYTKSTIGLISHFDFEETLDWLATRAVSYFNSLKAYHNEQVHTSAYMRNDFYDLMDTFSLFRFDLPKAVTDKLRKTKEKHGLQD